MPVRGEGVTRECGRRHASGQEKGIPDIKNNREHSERKEQNLLPVSVRDESQCAFCTTVVEGSWRQRLDHGAWGLPSRPLRDKQRVGFLTTHR